MSATNDIKNKTARLRKEPLAEQNQKTKPRFYRARDDYPDLIIGHNERGKKKERGPAPKTEPEPDYESEGIIPHN